MNRVAGTQRRKTLPRSVSLCCRGRARARRSLSCIPAVANLLISLSARKLVSKIPACVQININHDEGVCNVLRSWKPKTWITLKKSLLGRTRCIPSLRSASSIRAPTSVRSTRASAPSSECTTTCQVTGLRPQDRSDCDFCLKLLWFMCCSMVCLGIFMLDWWNAVRFVWKTWLFHCQTLCKERRPLTVWWCHHDADNIYVQC